MKEYTKTKEWVETDGNIATIGISKEIIEELGDVISIDFPEVSKEIKKGELLVNIESAKAVNSVYSPISGIVKEVNEKLISEPESLSDLEESEAWLVKMKI